MGVVLPLRPVDGTVLQEADCSHVYKSQVAKAPRSWGTPGILLRSTFAGITLRVAGKDCGMLYVAGDDRSALNAALSSPMSFASSSISVVA